MQHLGTEDEMEQVIREVWAALSEKDRQAWLAGLAPEQRLQGLAPEQRLQGLAPEELEQLRRLLARKDPEELTGPK